ncbi:hypothetical protein V5799_025460 [Amblyomma americanum]|uniref:Uncharacterized protein n=1 Tax=Amblyomma americanum TaxID=6943 RepID=A0AAQ4E9B2_AMBAM
MEMLSCLSVYCQACVTDDGHSPTSGPSELDISGGEHWNGLDFLCAAAEIHSAVASVERRYFQCTGVEFC